MNKLILCIFLSFSAFGHNLGAGNLDRDLSVVIVGAGPGGLASAIEAAQNGCRVTLIEKREEYSRSQPIGITKNTLRLLKKWNVFIPEIRLSNMDPEGDDFTGVLRISSLERNLSRKCEELGVKKIQGEFKAFGIKKEIYVNTSEEEIIIPYDVLIGADGFHSKIREAASIPMRYLASAKGAYVIIPDFKNPAKGSTLLIKEGESLARLVRIPTFTIISIQDPLDASKQRIERFAKTYHFTKEIKALEEEHLLMISENIPIVLAKAESFCDVEKSLVLLGDAVVSVSFVFGDGLNTALASAELLGDFFALLPKERDTAFLNFNNSMKELTEKLMRRNALLFNIEYYED